MKQMLKDLKAALGKFASSEKAKVYERFFKTGPETRSVAKKYKDLSFDDLTKLLPSPIHEDRLCALLILIEQFKQADEATKEKIYNFYLANTKYINNWDLIDLSANQIVGGYLADKPKDILKKLAKSK